MLLDFVLGGEFFARLTEVDAEIARQVAAGGCPFCGGPLHQANYRRKPRGGLLGGAGEAYAIRHSLCCGAEGCRRRALPPSLRFLGRRVYFEVVVLLASVLTQLAATVRVACARTGVPGWTLRRWSAWWREAFPSCATWVELRSRFAPPPPADSDMPRSLLVRLVEELQGRGPGTYPKTVDRLAKPDVLVLDDFGLTPMTDVERRDLLEVVEDRHERRATIVASQVDVKHWHELIGEPTIADAILDRLVASAHRIALKGKATMRGKRRASTSGKE